jgi:hypothetical protein
MKALVCIQLTSFGLRLSLLRAPSDRRLRDHESAATQLGLRLGPQWKVELDMHDDG